MQKNALDRGLILVGLILIGLGLVQVYSSSFMLAQEQHADGLFYVRKHALFCSLGILVLFATAHIPWYFIRRWGYWLWLVSAFGLLLTFLPGIGLRAGGAARWVKLPLGLNWEPAEFLRIGLGIMFAQCVAWSEETEGLTSRLWFKFLIILLPIGILLKQPDFGSFVICGLVLISLMYAFGLSIRYVLALLGASVVGGIALIIYEPYRLARLNAFLDPWSDPRNKGFQVIQSLIGFYSGGLTGVGLGDGQAKLFFLPEAHTDFILAVFAEETGFIGFCFIMFLYLFLLFRSFQIIFRVQDTFARIVATSATLALGFSIVINCAVVLNLVPTKGLSLPFMSYGGSSLLASCLALGLILNVDRHHSQKSVRWLRL